MKSAGTRPYRMTARAEAVREREEAVLDAAFDAFLSEYYDRITLRSIAADAGVTEQTVLRRFGSKEGLLEAVIERRGPRVRGPRGGAAPGDYRRAVREAVDSYELRGHQMLHVLAQEDRAPALRHATDRGRQGHHRTTAQVFSPWLPPVEDPEHRRALAPFVVALDVYTWKLLRLDLGLSRDETEATVLHMVERLLDSMAHDERDNGERDDHA